VFVKERRGIIKIVTSIIVVYIAGVVTLACSTPTGEFFYGSLGLGEQRLLVATANPGAYTVLLYDLDGQLIDVVADYTQTTDIPRGIAPFDAFSFAVLLDGADRIARASLTGEVVPDIFSEANFTGTLFQMTHDDLTDRYFAIETNTIEAVSRPTQEKIQNPYIAATVGTCVLNGPRGMWAKNGRLIVTSITNDRLNFYDVTGATSVCTSFNNAMGAVDPYAVLEHSQDGLIYYVSQTDDRVYSLPSNGVGASTIVWATNLPVINNPTAILELPDGTLLVASDGTNSIERITTAGVHVNGTSFIRDAFTGLVSQMMLIGGE
jgi:hypothetical protein